MVYMAARLAGGYAAVRRALNEVGVSDKLWLRSDFYPKRLFLSDQEEGSLLRPSVSAGFRFGAGNCGVVSVQLWRSFGCLSRTWQTVNAVSPAGRHTRAGPTL